MPSLERVLTHDAVEAWQNLFSQRNRTPLYGTLRQRTRPKRNPQAQPE
jgi:hypothetical protein